MFVLPTRSVKALTKEGCPTNKSFGKIQWHSSLLHNGEILIPLMPGPKSDQVIPFDIEITRGVSDLCGAEMDDRKNRP
jgi:hypothetical protein